MSYLKCVLPCAWPALTLIVGMFTIQYIRGRMIYRGPMPSDGPVNGFASQKAEIEYFDVTDQITRETFRAAWIIGIIGLVGTGIMYIVSTMI